MNIVTEIIPELELGLTLVAAIKQTVKDIKNKTPLSVDISQLADDIYSFAVKIEPELGAIIPQQSFDSDVQKLETILGFLGTAPAVTQATPAVAPVTASEVEASGLTAAEVGQLDSIAANG